MAKKLLKFVEVMTYLGVPLLKIMINQSSQKINFKKFNLII